MDTFEGTYGKPLARAARAAVHEVLAVKKDERVLVITNPSKDSMEISRSLYDAVLGAKAIPVVLIQREKSQFDFLEQEGVRAIETRPEVVISISKDRLGKDRYGMKHGYKGKRRYDHIFDFVHEEKEIRTFWSPRATVDMFERTVPIDYTHLRSDCSRVVNMLRKGDKVNVSAPGGTDVTIGIRGRMGRADDGNFRKPGRGGNLPSGEVYISPELGKMSGTISWDGSIVLNTGEIVIRQPIVADVRDGYITEISGGPQASKLEASVKMGERKALESGRKGEVKPDMARKYARNAWGIGELGIGLNRKARITANMLEDEKVYGTCHFAIGSNYDGDQEALIHLDGLVKRPTITVIRSDGTERTMMTDGRLTWD